MFWRARFNRGRMAAALAASLTLSASGWAEPRLTVATPTATANVQIWNGHGYTRPALFDWLKKAPADIRDYGRETFRRKNTAAILIVIASTALLLVADQYLVDKAHNLGDHLGITHTQYQKTFLELPIPGVKKKPGIEGPFDSGSALYFIGDGWVDLGLAGSFLGYGLAKSDNRALRTSSELAESILAGGTVVQVLKHVTGRESPFTTNTPGGVWRFFPNQFDYASNVPKYDAFPSGHLCAAMSAVTVIADNYPEHTYVRPVGYTLMGVLGFQMLNNGVHWASDYPLALAMGYGFGKIAVRKGRTEQGAAVHFYPMALRGGAGVTAICHFGPGAEQGRES